MTKKSEQIVKKKWYCGVVLGVGKRISVKFVDGDKRSNLSSELKLCDCKPEELVPIRIDELK